MEMSFGKLLLVVVVILIVFGAGRLPRVMEDLGKGLRSFKKAVNDNPDDKDVAEAKPIETVVVTKTAATAATPEPKDL